jgi:hypothetical protein
MRLSSIENVLRMRFPNIRGSRLLWNNDTKDVESPVECFPWSINKDFLNISCESRRTTLPDAASDTASSILSSICMQLSNLNTESFESFSYFCYSAASKLSGIGQHTRSESDHEFPRHFPLPSYYCSCISAFPRQKYIPQDLRSQCHYCIIFPP